MMIRNILYCCGGGEDTSTYGREFDESMFGGPTEKNN